MGTSKVYFTDFHTVAFGDGLPTKLKRLMQQAGADEIDFENKFTAVKMHFGEPGNLAYLRPNYAKAVADYVKSRGGLPFLTDCNTLYPGRRKNALEHIDSAYENGFSPFSTGCNVIIADGLKGTDDVEVNVDGGRLVKKAKIGRAIMDADIIISLTHFKGHELAGFGGTIKNIGMGCGSRAGKMEMHSSGKPAVHKSKCRMCHACARQCAQGAISYESGSARIDYTRCAGCGRCIGSCNFDAIFSRNNSAADELNCKMAEYAKAVLQGRPGFHISLVCDVSPNCDCHEENDVPILPDVGMFVSFDPVALDQACADACKKQDPIPGSQLYRKMKSPDFRDRFDHFRNSSPKSDWESCLEHAQKIGLGSRNYELIDLS